MRTQVHQFEGAPHALHPPCVAVAAWRAPAVQRVAPALAGGAEEVGRHAGHHRRAAVGAQLEQRLVGPDLGTVVGDEDRHVADDLHATLVGIVLQLQPLAEENTTGRTSRRPRARRAPASLPPAPRHRARPAGAARRTSPAAASASLKRHEQRIVVQPAVVARAEGCEAGAVDRPAPAATGSAAPPVPAAACGRVHHAAIVDARRRAGPAPARSRLAAANPAACSSCRSISSTLPAKAELLM